MLDTTTDAAVVITHAHTSRIRGGSNEDLTVTHDTEADAFEMEQDGNHLFMSRSEAEALFFVLDTMLHNAE